MHIALHVLKTAGFLRKAAALVLRGHDLSPAQFNILNLLSDQPDGLAAGTLAEELVVDPSNVTGLIKRMKADGLLAECPSPGDARRHVVRLSARGKKRWQKAHDDYAAELARLDSALAKKGFTKAGLKPAHELLVTIDTHCHELLD